MHNLKKQTGTFKGTIGECMFRIVYNKVIINRFFNKQRCLDYYYNYFTKNQLNFLDTYWSSIDAFEVDEKNKKIILYEIKIRAAEYKNMDYPMRLSPRIAQIYKKAPELSFETKLAIVWFCNNWEYYIEIINFDDGYYYIDHSQNYKRYKMNTIFKN